MNSKVMLSVTLTETAWGVPNQAVSHTKTLYGERRHLSYLASYNQGFNRTIMFTLRLAIMSTWLGIGRRIAKKSGNYMTTLSLSNSPYVVANRTFKCKVC